MSESGDYDPGQWRGHDFQSAYASYDRHVGRSYDDAVSSGRRASTLIPATLKSNSESPLVIGIDVTGSMGEWPKTIFSKLPYLEHEAKDYLGDETEISFFAVGDAHSDQYPLQVRPFDKGTHLKSRLEELIIEGNGGGQKKESYELPALYYARNVDLPKVIRNPVYIFIGDEGFYDIANKDQAEQWARVKLEQSMQTADVFKELQESYSVYLVRKPYELTGSDSMSSIDQIISRQWESVLGADHIAPLADPGRVVDVIFGILAQEAHRVKDFEKELRGRQTPEQVRTVMKSLHSIHYLPKHSVKKIGFGNSMMRAKTGGAAAKPLIE